MPPAATRLRLSPWRLDVLIGALVSAEFLCELLFFVPRSAPDRAAAAVVLVLAGSGFALRRRAPLVTVAAMFLGLLTLEALSSYYPVHLAGPYFGTFAATLSLGAYAGRRALIAGCVIAAAAITVVQFVTPDDAGDYIFGLCVEIAAPVLLGSLLRSRSVMNRALREKTAALEAARAGAADRAVADERTRIAGELHDVVAHSLSAMTVQAGAAHRLAMAGHAGARDAFAAIERTGREALDELRRLLGVLRREDAELALAPQPSLRHLGSLAGRASAAGLPVALDVAGELPPLPAGLDLTAYRVVQEALAGAHEPGGAGRAEVRVRISAGALELAVLDDGHAAQTRPLVGIRERVELHGGRLTAGPRRAGGHAVRAWLPLDGEVAPNATPEPVAAPCPATVARGLRERVRDVVVAVRRLEPVAVDRAIAGFAAVLGIAEVLTSRDLSGPAGFNVLLVLGYTLPLAWRRRAPLRALAFTLASAIAMGLWLTALTQLFVPYGAVLLLAFACGARLERAGALAGAALLATGVPLVVASMPDQAAANYFFPTLICLGTWGSGRVVRSRTQLTERLHEAAARLAEQHAEEAVRAAAEERRRIAREMHDLVAHSMSVMVVQAGGARRIIGRDAGRAVQAAARIERIGREALAEMRHLLGMLHPGAEPAALAPQPTLAELGALVERAKAAGLPAVLSHRGERHPLPAGLDLAAYRIVQEALTNALKHAHGAPTEITVDWAPDAIALAVVDRGGARAGVANGGHGLVGMRERVRLYGGELETGPLPDGGWHVRATLPCGDREDIRASITNGSTGRPALARPRGAVM
jgi:signal transduction histidine kinase